MLELLVAAVFAYLAYLAAGNTANFELGFESVFWAASAVILLILGAGLAVHALVQLFDNE